MSFSLKADGQISSVKKGKIKLGIDCLEEEGYVILKGKRVGLVTNQSGVNGSGVKTRLLMAKAKEVNLVALYTPEHGLDGTELAGKWVPSRVDPATGVVAYSLYGKTRKPTHEMLKNIDVLVFDIQDVGARCYTYLSTMGLCMEAAGEAGKEFIILDRPNPVGGSRISGPPIERNWMSFVGQYPVPFMHGLTAGELAQMIVGEGWIKKVPRLKVVELKGWNRKMKWKDTGLKWVKTSPNIPRAESCEYYLATGIAQHVPGIYAGTGSSKPFQCVAVKGVDERALTAELNGYQMRGVEFIPFSDKTPSGKRGVKVRLIFDESPDLLQIGMVLLNSFYHASKSAGIDLIESAGESGRSLLFKVYGSDSLQHDLRSGKEPRRIIDDWIEPNNVFRKRRAKYLLYK